MLFKFSSIFLIVSFELTLALNYGETPFDAVQKYIEKYEKGIEELQQSSGRYARHDEYDHFDRSQVNESEALAREYFHLYITFTFYSLQYRAYT